MCRLSFNYRRIASRPITMPVRTVKRAAPKPTKLIPIGLGENVINRLFAVSDNLRSFWQKGDFTSRIINEEEGKIRSVLELEEKWAEGSIALHLGN